MVAADCSTGADLYLSCANKRAVFGQQNGDLVWCDHSRADDDCICSHGLFLSTESALDVDSASGGYLLYGCDRSFGDELLVWPWRSMEGKSPGSSGIHACLSDRLA